jgi:hypothetical protein
MERNQDTGSAGKLRPHGGRERDRILIAGQDMGLQANYDLAKAAASLSNCASQCLGW